MVSACRQLLLPFYAILALMSFSSISYGQNIAKKLAAIEALVDKNQAIISLEMLLRDNTLTTADRLSSLIVQSKAYHQLGKLDYAIASAQKEQQLAEKFGLIKEEAEASKRIGIFAYFKGDNTLAAESYLKALTYYQRVDKPLLQAHLYNNLGLVYAATSDLEKALANYRDAESRYLKFGTEQDQVDLRFNIAGLHLRLKHYDTAISMYLDVIERRTEFNDDIGLALAHADIGSAYKYAGNYEIALSYMIKALEFHLLNKAYYNAASVLNNLSELNNYLNNIDQAIAYGKEGVRQGLAHGNNDAYAGSLYNLATAYFYQGNLDLALEYVNKSSKVAEKIAYKAQLNENVALRSLIYAAQNKPIKAIETHRKFLTTHMELSNNQLNTKLALFNSQQLKQQVNQLTQQKLLKELEIERAKQRRNFIIVAIFCVLLIAFLISRRDIERRSKQVLEKKVKQRTNELERLMEELQNANNIKSQFLANMSHEIRTPLTTVIGQAEAIVNGDVEEAFITKEVEIIHGNSLHLLELTNNILDLSKIEANKIELDTQSQDLHDILQELANMFELQASSKGLAFSIVHTLPQPFNIEIDGFRVKQVLMNLCSNAIKFTAKGHVKLNISQGENKLNFKITDSGIGMSSSQLKTLFESFTQGDSSISRRFGGTGLGLCLSEQLANIMGGTIEVESELNHGSVFVFSLPCEYCKEMEVQEAIITVENKQIEIPQMSLTGKVLLADDHHDNRRLIARLLRSMGLEVISAHNGQEAVQLFSKHEPALILMDIQMPEMDGIEAFNVLRQQGCDKPIIALTANAMSHEVEHYLSMGFSGFLSKPIDKSAFISTVSKYYEGNISEARAEEKFSKIDMSDLIQEFKSNLVLEQQDLILHVNQQDFEKLSRLSHRIAGAAKMFGFEQLSNKALMLEVTIKNNKNQEINTFAQDLLNEIDQVLW